MKKGILSVLVILLITTISFAQREERHGEKIKALEKIKLIEALDLDEETAVKFFARRNEHQERMKKIFSELETKRNEIRKLISSAENDDDPELKKQVENYFKIHQKIDEEKRKFVESLDDILSNKQIAELTLFERRFREEIRDVLMMKRRNRK